MLIYYNQHKRDFNYFFNAGNCTEYCKSLMWIHDFLSPVLVVGGGVVVVAAGLFVGAYVAVVVVVLMLWLLWWQ